MPQNALKMRHLNKTKGDSTGIVRHGRTLSVMPTYQCTAECENCGTLSSPLAKTHLSAEQVSKAIEEAGSLDFVNVVFTGGEPTLRYPILCDGLRLAKREGLATRIVTNAHWAKSPDIARRKLEDLLSFGLDEINFSSGDQHARFVPIERVINAVLAACDLGMRFHLMVETTAQNRIRKSTFTDHPALIQKVSQYQRSLWIDESPWMPLSPIETNLYDKGLAINKLNIASCTGCESILQTIVVQADGRIGACCGLGMRTVPELQVGHIDDLNPIRSAIEIAEQDLLKLALRYIGAEKILAWAAGCEPSILWEDKYAHRCQACMRIYKDPKVRAVIRNHLSDLEADIAAAALFDEVSWPNYMGAAKMEEAQQGVAPNA